MEGLSEVAETVLEARYLRQDETGAVIETPEGMFRRVARNLARPEGRFGGDPGAVEDAFFELMTEFDFLPNSPTLMNAGTELQQLAACFVLPVGDSIESIFDAVKHTALIHQSGGGTGFSFSKLRPSGDTVLKTGGVASGPVSFMKIFDAATEQIKQGGRRRGANMGILDVTHPDIGAFIDVKDDPETLQNFNLSVATDNTFWNALAAGEPLELINPRTGAVIATADPDGLLDRIARMAWATGDPGMIFLDRINQDNPTPSLGRTEATNPCGEQPLLPYEACTLGSINVGNHTEAGEIDWAALEATVHLAVRFLDNAVTMSDFPIPEIEERVAETRKIGLGVMGFHDLLVDLGIPYDSDDAVEVAEELMAFIDEESHAASRTLADEREPFPAWEESTYDDPIRNAVTTTIAPTGTISMIADCSASIEPIYNVAYTKHVMGGLEVRNERFVTIAKDRDCYSDELIETVHGRTSIQDVDAVPDDVKRLFQTAHDVPPERHLEIQAAFQRHVDNAVSKTVNLPESAEVDAVRDIFVRARELDLKGVTVFRSGARPEQVLGADPLKEECISECEYVGSRK